MHTPSPPLLPLVRFNLRVYGLWVNSRNELLVSEEYLSRARGNAIIFKFPGGGVQLGEGLAEALRREWHEELGLPINQLAHYYTTDFFQRSAFDPREQIVSVYYKVQSPEGQPLVKHDETDDAIAYHWWPLHSLEPERLSLPIDQHVARLLLTGLTP